MVEQQVLEELKKYDTPSITNVVATYPDHPLCLGLYNPWSENWYTDQTIHCMYPELGALCGYAVTCVFGLPDPGYSRLTFMDIVDALDNDGETVGSIHLARRSQEIIFGLIESHRRSGARVELPLTERNLYVGRKDW